MGGDTPMVSVDLGGGMPPPSSLPRPLIAPIQELNLTYEFFRNLA